MAVVYLQLLNAHYESALQSFVGPVIRVNAENDLLTVLAHVQAAIKTLEHAEQQPYHYVLPVKSWQDYATVDSGHPHSLSVSQPVMIKAPYVDIKLCDGVCPDHALMLDTSEAQEAPLDQLLVSHSQRKVQRSRRLLDCFMESDDEHDVALATYAVKHIHGHCC